MPLGSILAAFGVAVLGFLAVELAGVAAEEREEAGDASTAVVSRSVCDRFFFGLRSATVKLFVSESSSKKMKWGGGSNSFNASSTFCDCAVIFAKKNSKKIDG